MITAANDSIRMERMGGRKMEINRLPYFFQQEYVCFDKIKNERRASETVYSPVFPDTRRLNGKGAER